MSTEPAPVAAHSLRFELDDVDGELGKRFAPDGKVEVWIVAVPLDEDGRLDRNGRLPFIILDFDSYEAVDLAKHDLEAFVQAANSHLELLRERRNLPRRQGDHLHRVRFERFSRALPPRAVCERCMEVLVEDVGGWAKERGLIAGELVTSEVREHRNTIRTEIERTVNKVG